MSGPDWQLVSYSAFGNQYMASVYYPYETFRQILREYTIAFASFSMRHIVEI